MLVLAVQITAAKAQEYVHQVIVLNEGYFDYNLNQSIVPPTVGSYNPTTQAYTSVDTLHTGFFLT